MMDKLNDIHMNYMIVTSMLSSIVIGHSIVQGCFCEDYE